MIFSCYQSFSQNFLVFHSVDTFAYVFVLVLYSFFCECICWLSCESTFFVFTLNLQFKCNFSAQMGYFLFGLWQMHTQAKRSDLMLSDKSVWGRMWVLCVFLWRLCSRMAVMYIFCKGKWFIQRHSGRIQKSVYILNLKCCFKFVLPRIQRILWEISPCNIFVSPRSFQPIVIVFTAMSPSARSWFPQGFSTLELFMVRWKAEQAINKMSLTPGTRCIFVIGALSILLEPSDCLEVLMGPRNFPLAEDQVRILLVTLLALGFLILLGCCGKLDDLA